MYHICNNIGGVGLTTLDAGAGSWLRSQHRDNAAMWLRHRRWPRPDSEACGQSKYLSGFLPAGKAADQRSLCHGGASAGGGGGGGVVESEKNPLF